MNHEELRRARKAANKTQDELADHLGVNRATVSKYENGIIEPTVETLKKIASFLGTTIYKLFDAYGEIDREYEQIEKDISSAFDDGYSLGYEHGVKTGASSVYAKISIDAKTQEANRLVAAFAQLNEEGKQKAVERVEELTEIPKYQKEKAPDEDPKP